MIIIEVIRKRLKKAVNNHDKHPPWLSALLPISASPFSQNSYYLHTITKNIYGSLSAPPPPRPLVFLLPPSKIYKENQTSTSTEVWVGPIMMDKDVIEELQLITLQKWR